MVWKFNGARPVYQQIIEQIQGAVISGEFSPGDRIPSVRDLATAAQVNPNTMQHALQELERQHLLVTRGTSGRYVTDDTAVLDALQKRQLKALTLECAKRYAVLGISPAQAARLLLELDKERTEE